MKLKTKDLLTGDEISSKEFLKLIDFSIKLKKQNKTGKEKPLLKNKTLAMIFEKPSTRTRVSFEVGMLQLGGHAVNLSSNQMNIPVASQLRILQKLYLVMLMQLWRECMSMILLRNLQNILPFRSLMDYLIHIIHAKL